MIQFHNENPKKKEKEKQTKTTNKMYAKVNK